MNFPFHKIDAPSFRFSHGDHAAVSADKFRGLQRFGPYTRLAEPPVIGFVFPREMRDLANRLYLAIRNGVGPYRGFSNLFRAPLEKDQVFQVSNFSIDGVGREPDRAQRYVDAITNWNESVTTRPDIFLVLHPRSPSWEGNTPDYRCKSLMLRHGLLSQDVTTDLIEHSPQFDWSVANIALAMFVKLGGIPWVVDRRTGHREIVLGVGRTDLMDPAARNARRYAAFTIGLRGDGPFEFTAIATPADNEADYLRGLASMLREALARVEQGEDRAEAITLHLSKEFGHAEAAVIDEVVGSRAPTAIVNVLKVADDHDFFAVDPGRGDGVPARGTCIQVSDNDVLLYSEGHEEKLAWRNRVPTALRIRSYGTRPPTGAFRELIAQVYDLSQVNYRAFNATCRPVSLAYGGMIVRLLAHIPLEHVGDGAPVGSQLAGQRMWFL